MSLITVPMYRIVCDFPACEKSPQDDGEFYAWAQPEAAVEEAVDAAWSHGPDGRFCCEHPAVWASDLEGEEGGAWDLGGIVDTPWPLLVRDDISPRQDEAEAHLVADEAGLLSLLDRLANLEAVAR